MRGNSSIENPWYYFNEIHAKKRQGFGNLDENTETTTNAEYLPNFF